MISWYSRAGQSSIIHADQLESEGAADQAKKELTKALEWTKRAWQVSQETGRVQAPAFNQLLGLMGRLGYHGDVLKLVDANLSKEAPQTYLLLHKAEALYRLGRKDEALDVFAKTIENASGAALSRVIYSKLPVVGEPQELMSWAQEKVKTRPDWPGGHLMVARLHSSLGEHDKEAAALLAGRSVADDELKLRIDQLLAVAYTQAGNMDRALESYRKVLKEQPDSVPVLNNMAYIMLQQGGDIDEAVRLSKRSLDLAGGNPNFMDTYALAMLAKGDFQAAEKTSRRAIQALKRQEQTVSAEFYLHLAEALKGLGRNAEALEALQKPGDEELARADEAVRAAFADLLAQFERGEN